MLTSAQTSVVVILTFEGKASGVCRVPNNLEDTLNFSGRDIFKTIQFLTGKILSLAKLKNTKSQIVLSPQCDREKNASNFVVYLISKG